MQRKSFKNNKLNFKIIVFFLLFFSINGYAERKDILVLHSYHHGMLWTDNINKGYKDALKEKLDDINFKYEYLDHKLNTGENYKKNLYHFLYTKYKDKKFDYILIIDNDALDFVNQYKDKLFIETPKVFCGINNFKYSLIAELKNVTGVTQRLDLEAIFNFIIKQHPEKKKILFLIDNSQTGAAVKQEILRTQSIFHGKLEYEFIQEYEFMKIKYELSKLTDDYVIYLSQFLKDSKDNVQTDSEAVKRVVSYTELPVYGSWNIMVGNGAIGGKVSTGYYQGLYAGEILSKLLDGDDINSIPVNTKSPSVFKFDYNILKKFNISLSSLPKGSIILNKPRSILDNKNVVITLLISILIISIIAFGYVFYYQKIRSKKLALTNMILDRKVYQRTQELQNMVKELEAIFDNTSVGIIVLSNQLKIRKANSKFYDIFGYSKEEILGKCVDIIHKDEDDFKKFSSKVLNDLEKLPYLNLEHQYIKANNEIIHCTIYINPIEQNGKRLHTICVIEDITERKKMENLKEEVERIMRHDLKTPVNGIIGFQQLLKLDKNITDEQHEYLNDIGACAMKILNMVNSSMDLMKIENGTYNFIPSQVDIVDTVKVVGKDLQNKMVQYKVSMKCFINDVPLKNTDALYIKGDMLLCYTAIGNLLNNAIEASEENEEIKVKFGMNNGVWISIQNNAVVPENLRDSFFEKYATYGKKTGTGIGTYSAKLMTEIQNGKIFMETSKEKGTKVSLFFPECIN